MKKRQEYLSTQQRLRAVSERLEELQEEVRGLRNDVIALNFERASIMSELETERRDNVLGTWWRRRK